MYRNKDEFEARSRKTFVDNAPMSLRELRGRIDVNASGISRRDMLSALDSLERLFGRDLGTVPATTKSVRSLFSSKKAPELRISEKRYANIRSCIVGALRDHGEAPAPITKRIPLMPQWKALLGKIDNPNHRFALYRLSSYCSHMRIAPRDVSTKVLLGLFHALEAEEVVKDPRRLLKHTIAHWNMCGQRVQGWPRVRLASPFERNTIGLPLSKFPKGFQRDLRTWKARLLAADPLDIEAPIRPLKPISVEGMERMIVRFASALVRTGVRIDKIQKLNALVELPNYKAGLRFFLHRFNDEPNPYVGKLARTLYYMAKHYCRLSPEALAELELLRRRVDVDRNRQMTPRNRERLSQFDDPDNVSKLLRFPQEERARGLANKNPYRATKCLERALSVAILISCCLRIQNLRTIDLTTDIRWVKDKCYLSIDGSKVKNRQSLAFELPPDVADLLREFVRDYRPRLPGSNGPYLFPGRNGGPRPHSTMRTDFKDAMRKRLGLILNPHLMRHFIAKIVVGKDPALAVAVSQLLGHKRIDMTMAHYLGTEGREAGRRIDRLLRDARDGSLVSAA